MATINSALNIMAKAIDADQSALNIVANNVANANTPGYTAQRAVWQENSPVRISGSCYGDGASQSGPQSLRDRVLEQRLNQQQQLASASGSRLSALQTLEAVFTPSSGSSSSNAGNIGTDLTSFFSSFSSLEANPTSNALRQQVLSSGSTLAGDISNAAASVSAQRAALDQEAAGMTSQINALTANLAAVNQQIQSVSPSGDAGVLEDQRQQDLAALSKLTGVNVVTTENNGVSVTTAGGQLLVSGASNFPLTTGTVGGVTHFFVGATDVTADLTSGGGQLGGQLTARDQDLTSALNSLDQLAYGVSTQVNTLNNAGSDLAGDNGNAGNIFTQPAAVAGAALGMKVAMTDPNHIAAAGLGKGTGDNSNAVALAGLASSAIVNGQTPTNAYSNFVSTLGATVSSVKTVNTAQNASVSQLTSQNNAISGVNLNDEASAMSTLERSYQAASEVYAILNRVMASAINLGEQTTVS